MKEVPRVFAISDIQRASMVECMSVVSEAA